MVKIIKNEFRKFFYNKAFIFEVLFMVGLCALAVVAYKDMAETVIKNLPKAQSLSEEIKNALLNLNGTVFSTLFLTDYIYKSYFSFFLIFIVTNAVHLFSFDRENGTMKFSLLTGVERETLLYWKLLFIVLKIVSVVFFNMVLSLLIGMFFFGKISDLNQIIEYAGIGLCSILPGVSTAMLIALLSQIHTSSKAVMGIGLLAVLVLGMLDTMTDAHWFSPIGVLSIFYNEVPKINSTLLTHCFVSLIYCVVGFIILRGIVRKYEFYE